MSLVLDLRSPVVPSLTPFLGGRFPLLKSTTEKQQTTTTEKAQKTENKKGTNSFQALKSGGPSPKSSSAGPGVVGFLSPASSLSHGKARERGTATSPTYSHSQVGRSSSFLAFNFIQLTHHSLTV